MRLHIGHLAFRVPDPERSASFLSEILGLRRTLDEEDAIFLSANEKHHEIEYLRGPRAGVDHLGIEVEDERDLETIHDRLVAHGAPILGEDAVRSRASGARSGSSRRWGSCSSSTRRWSASR